jgi:hypothetical protein
MRMAIRDTPKAQKCYAKGLPSEKAAALLPPAGKSHCLPAVLEPGIECATTDRLSEDAPLAAVRARHAYHHLEVVVFPAPFRPTKPQMDPAGTVKFAYRELEHVKRHAHLEFMEESELKKLSPFWTRTCGCGSRSFGSFGQELFDSLASVVALVDFQRADGVPSQLRFHSYLLKDST